MVPGGASSTGSARADIAYSPRRSLVSATARICCAHGIDLSLHIADVLGVIKYEQLKNIVLVGHSYGGCVISGIAEAVCPMQDQTRWSFSTLSFQTMANSTFDLVQPAVQEVIQRRACGAGEIDRARARLQRRFSVNEKDRAWVNSLATPQPIATMTEKLTLSGARERDAE